MIAQLLIGCALLAALDNGTAARTADLDAYQKLKAEAGRDPDSHVRLALWCESKGLAAERTRHLAMAVLLDPNHPTARGLLGLVSSDGKWLRPEDVAKQLATDESSQTLIQEYLKRRAETPLKAESQWKLARWCEENGLAEQARAHDCQVVRLDPRREAAWKKLGYVKSGDGWARPEEVAAQKEEREEQKRANRHWKPIIERYRDDLLSKVAAQRARAEAALAEITDPRAVPAVWQVFVSGDSNSQLLALRILGQIDGTAASRAIAAIAVMSSHAMVRGRAIDTAERRDPREFLEELISLIHRPFKYSVQPLNGPGSTGGLFVDGEKFNVQRIYQVEGLDLRKLPRRLFTSNVPFNPFSARNLVIAAVETVVGAQAAGGVSLQGTNAQSAAIQRDQVIARHLGRVRDSLMQAEQSLAQDIQAIEMTNAGIKKTNARVLPLLSATTGVNFGDDRERWWTWWNDQLGYAYQSPDTTPKPVYTELIQVYMPPVPHTGSCFAVGTPVHTIDGPRPIESIEVGDRVLSQDPRTGSLSFQPILAIHHNSPAPTLKLRLGDETVVATGIHRFWKAGKGWTMARDLKAGDIVRTLGGTARLESVEPGAVQPVYNLDVAENRDFFVGSRGFLVYDFSTVQPVETPFDQLTPVKSAGVAMK